MTTNSFPHTKKNTFEYYSSMFGAKKVYTKSKMKNIETKTNMLSVQDSIVNSLLPHSKSFLFRSFVFPLFFAVPLSVAFLENRFSSIFQKTMEQTQEQIWKKKKLIILSHSRKLLVFFLKFSKYIHEM